MLKFLKLLLTPEWATFNFGGGGGGGSQPTNQNITQTNVPKYLQPNMERLAGQAEAIANSEYIPYGGERFAGFNNFQNKAFQEAENLAPAQQLGLGTQFAGMSGLGSMQAGQNYQNMATNPYAMQSYMSPYIQNALAPQMQEAARQSDIQGQQNAGQAARAGAFGGSRFGLQEAERQRNLGTLQNSIYGTGMQNAFQNAQQAQQFGATLGLQGYGQGLQAANTLGQLGQTQFGQQQAGMQARAAAGQQQQDFEQAKLQQQYQDFLDQRGYNQKQISWLSDIYHGIPGSQTTQTMFQAPPSPIATAGGLGAMYLGAQKAFKSKEGGLLGVALHNMANGN
jgi:hypothetical protein